ncbi:MAG: CCA tRNA nucleotidyltransferase [Alphaproteobacteria bacterium]|nr:CCA tRNA nucleotidyltransferase [Alphaproteobacteria bacterium]
MAEKKTGPTKAEVAALKALAAAPWLKDARCQRVFDALEAGGYPARAVGGAVRNTLMGLEAADVDIATPALPQTVMSLCRAAGLGVHATGLEHGTITVVSGRAPYEVTTLRRDIETHGRHATVAFTEDWQEDAGRRDFTMNAIYCDRHGGIHDPLGGLSDLMVGHVRFIGSAVERIREDYLRILRFFRFFATYGKGDIDRDGLQACLNEREGLSQLSAERVGAELLKLLIAPRARDALDVMAATGIDRIVTGHRSDLARFEKLAALQTRFGRPPDPMLRLAALATQSASDARAVASRLRLSNAQRSLLVVAADARTDAQFDDESAQRIALYRFGEEAYLVQCLMAWARSKTPVDEDGHFRKAIELPARWLPGSLPFKGSDVVSLGVPPGPIVGEVLRQFEDWWVEAGFPLDRKLLEAQLSVLVDATRQ